MVADLFAVDIIVGQQMCAKLARHYVVLALLSVQLSGFDQTRRRPLIYDDPSCSSTVVPEILSICWVST
jgi:hypothetical protein